MHLPSPQIGKPTQYFFYFFFCCLLLNIYRDIVKKINKNKILHLQTILFYTGVSFVQTQKETQKDIKYLCLVFANGGLFCINDTMTAVCDVSLLNQADICSNVFKNTLN